ncbi:hypothetical protein P3G70_14630, partial [Staphylococcus aureus]|nr:hypothetical protein [Staphylococcus aureus]
RSTRPVLRRQRQMCIRDRHRSVALAKRLAEYLNEIFEYNVYVHHRDAHIESGER